MTSTRRTIVRACAGAILLTASLLQAGDAILRLDAAATKVEYTVDTTLHTVHGEFKMTSGSLRFDESTGKASGEIVVDARSGESGSSGRDQRMHHLVLESDRFPTIVFRPDRVDGHISEGAPSKVNIHGVFSIHGADHEITAPAEVRRNGGDYAVTATIDVPYVKWGMKNPGNFVLHVNEIVHITVQTVAHATQTSSQTSDH